MKLVKRAKQAAPLSDAVIALRLQTIFAREKIQRGINDPGQAVPSERG
jgi:hypothetical protein